jgi:transglutaminase-like putative cysteine protease
MTWKNTPASVTLVLLISAFLLCVQDAFAGPAYAVISQRTSIHVRSDLSVVEEQVLVQRVHHAVAIESLGHQRVTFVPGLEQVEILEAWTRLGDGTKVPVSKDRIVEEQVARSDVEVQFTDRKAKVVIFPKVAAGVDVHLKIRKTRRSPIFPGVYSRWIWWPTSVPHVDVAVEILYEAGVDITATVRDPGKNLKGGREPSRRGDPPGSTRHRYTYVNLDSEFHEADRIASTDFAPSLQFGNLKSWSDVAKAYGSRAQPVVTPAISTKAQEITMGARSLMQRVERVHHWLARNVRYVSVSLLNGGFVPRSANSVLERGYGDCKDKTILLQALLAALGIDSSAVLVDTDDAYVLPPQPTPFTFDHVMVYVPALNLYLDSTAEYARVGTLPLHLMGKPVLHVKDGRLSRTPVASPRSDFTETTVNLFMDEVGVINGDSTAIMRGYPEVESRYAVARGFEKGESSFVNRLLSRAQEAGKGEIQAQPGNLDQPWKVHASFELEPVVNRPGPAAFRLPLGLAPGRISGMTTREVDTGRKRPYVCESVRHDETINLELPAGQVVEAVPQSVSFRQGPLSYTAHYVLNGRMLTARRTFIADRKQPFCQPKDEEDWLAFRKVLLRDLRGQVVLR